MRLSFSTNAYVRFEIAEAAQRIAAIGYEGVELLADVPHLYAASVTERDLRRLKSVLDRTMLQVANINANTAVGYYGREFWEPLFEPSLAHSDSSLRQWRIDYTKKCIDIAELLSAPCISITSGRTVPGCLPDTSLELLCDSLAHLLEYAEKRSIRIGIEYEPGLLIERCEELATLLDRMGSSFLGANLDLGHSHVLGEDPRTVIEALAGRIYHIHLEDIADRKHYHLIPGEGDIDFGLLFDLLAASGYDGFATVELYTYLHKPDEAAQKAFVHLQKFL